jgi:hypothetical protein
VDVYPCDMATMQVLPISQLSVAMTLTVIGTILWFVNASVAEICRLVGNAFAE